MRAESRHKTTVRSIGPLFHFINYFDSQSGGRGSGQRPIVASSQSCLNPFHARSVNLDCKDIKGGSPCQKFFFSSCRQNICTWRKVKWLSPAWGQWRRSREYQLLYLSHVWFAPNLRRCCLTLREVVRNPSTLMLNESEEHFYFYF